MSLSASFLGRINDAWEQARFAIIRQFEEFQATLSPALANLDTLRTTVAATGAWITPPFAATNFTGFTAQTWTVATASVITFRYTLIGATMVLAFDIRSTTVGGAASIALQIKIPGGWLAESAVENPVKLIDNGAHVTGWAVTSARSNLVLIERTDVANFAASAGATSVQGQITFPVTV